MPATGELTENQQAVLDQIAGNLNPQYQRQQQTQKAAPKGYPPQSYVPQSYQEHVNPVQSQPTTGRGAARRRR